MNVGITGLKKEVEGLVYGVYGLNEDEITIIGE
jgi:hypothetical protein